MLMLYSGLCFIWMLSLASDVHGFSEPLHRVKRNIETVKSGITAGDLAKELALLANFAARRAVAVTNNGDVWLRLWCASRDDNIGEHHLQPGESMVFSFRPLVVGGRTVFWCSLDYKYFWARWDAFNEDMPYIHVRQYDKHYQYIVRDDGLYLNGQKIRSLASGQNRYILWENYDENKNPNGASLTGFVDSGICNNIPNWMEDKTSSVTVCDHQCVILYEHLHCEGQTSRLQANDGCSNFWLSFFNDRASSVKGC